jgi:predicted DNA-binding transcriptional regulator AlpA
VTDLSHKSLSQPFGTIYDMKTAAALCNLSLRQFQRLISLGEGPATIQLSARRVGLAEADKNEWLNSRRRPAPSLQAA